MLRPSAEHDMPNAFSMRSRRLPGQTNRQGKRSTSSAARCAHKRVRPWCDHARRGRVEFPDGLPKIDHGIVIVEVFCREQQQSGLMLHRSRQLLVCQRTMLSNAIRGHLAELGIIAAKGRNGTAELLKIIADEQDDRIPAAARFSLDVLARQYAAKSSGQSGAVHT
jgi:hypothetical protein